MTSSSDPLKREFYDVNGFYTDGVLEQRGARCRAGDSVSRDSTSPVRADREFSEIFGQVLAGRPSRGQPERGQDLEYPVSISFEESHSGPQAQHQRVTASDVCRSMRWERPGGRPRDRLVQDAAGRKDNADQGPSCSLLSPASNAAGRARSITPVPLIVAVKAVFPATKASRCRVTGRRETGSRIRIPGKGDAGRFGGPAGDLYVVVNAAGTSVL